MRWDNGRNDLRALPVDGSTSLEGRRPCCALYLATTTISSSCVGATTGRGSGLGLHDAQ